MSLVVLLRGGGDLASGVALRLHRCGFQVIISELAKPLSVRRMVSFAEAIYSGSITVEGCTARRVESLNDTLLVSEFFSKGQIPVLIDPSGDAIGLYQPGVIVDARMLKEAVACDLKSGRLLIGLGPGFTVGINCDVVIETNRGISMGRVIRSGSAESNTGVPEIVFGRKEDRVLRAPADGIVEERARIGDLVDSGQTVAEVGGQAVTAPFKGVLRGLIHPGLQVKKGMKLGDVDPRGDPRVCTQVSDKSLAVAGGVLEAILSSH